MNEDGVIRSHKDLGLVNEVFPAERLRSLARAPSP